MTMPTPQPVAAMQTAAPWRWTRPVQPLVDRREQRADGGRGEEQAQRAGAAQVGGDGREERLGHPEEHRHDVDGVRADELGTRAGVVGALDGSGACSGARPRRGGGTARIILSAMSETTKVATSTP